MKEKLEIGPYDLSCSGSMLGFFDAWIHHRFFQAFRKSTTLKREVAEMTDY